MITRAVLKLSTDFTDESMMARVLERLRNPSEIVSVFAKAPPDQPWFWLAVLAAVLVFIRQAVRYEAFLLVAVSLQLGLMFAQGLATPWDFAAHVSLTLNRLPHQMAPAAAFLAVIVLMRELFASPDVQLAPSWPRSERRELEQRRQPDLERRRQVEAQIRRRRVRQREQRDARVRVGEVEREREVAARRSRRRGP